MNIEKLKQAMQLMEAIGDGGCVTDFPESVGTKVFIRTVTMYYLGEIKKICGQWITLEDASWVADTGYFHDFLKEGKANSIEPFCDDVHIPMTAIIDVTEWKHALPKKTIGR